ncbi:hypothetical protein B0H14DRAFT_2650553 [Mycena olivaceomarginata]|nr:hypothetical protein B0H14DRAFT_2650553 [Mycena olivaceomarginata]
MGLKSWITDCDTILAALHVREKGLLAAKSMFEKCLKLNLHSESESFCLEGLGNVSQWDVEYSVSGWTTAFLAYSLKHKKTLEIHKALQFLGDVFLAQQDEDTAISLFTVALEGFILMDVHHSRAECMIRLGDNFKQHGDILQAVELWNVARPLFERSSQVKEVKYIDERLACVGSDVLEQHRENQVCLADLHVGEDNLSVAKIADSEEVHLSNE